MKAEEVLNLLQISRKTLHVYAHDGRIRYTVMPNKRYDYSEEDVYKILNKDVKRKTVLYARVSTSRQKNDLQNQIDQMKQWCFMNGYTINAIYSDIASGISFEKRKGFFEMLDEITYIRLTGESKEGLFTTARVDIFLTCSGSVPLPPPRIRQSDPVGFPVLHYGIDMVK